MRKVSVDHRPIFFMVLSETPAKCSAIAPLARRLWLEMFRWCKPKRCSPSFCQACPVMDFIGWFRSKYEANIVFGFLVCFIICLMRLMMALTGHAGRFSAYCVIDFARTPFF